MVKKKVDPRIRGLIEYNIQKNHRSLLILVGDHGKDQVENIHKILSKSRVKARPSVLWCYKKELGFSTHRKKRIKEIKRDQSRGSCFMFIVYISYPIYIYCLHLLIHYNLTLY